ncbi:hypothetical protein FD754_008786 [Muntiacus muntjak]|uniref:NADP-dependent oxidoreductase domain-containing protein n=1 Tax=Muntiacus muntjak TaxID=9888 RepID=A0A5N3WS31_MUNMU|nr:hypothetical protein FD754_008786 [Muntiacus muntjak]
MRETCVQALSWEDLLEEGKVTHSSVLAWRIPVDRGAWWTTVHGVTRSRTRLSGKGQHSIWARLIREQRNGPQLKCLGTVPSRLSLTSYLDFTWLEFIDNLNPLSRLLSMAYRLPLTSFTAALFLGSIHFLTQTSVTPTRPSHWTTSPGCSLEGLMLKLKLQYFGHLMRRVDSLEKTLMLGGIEGRRRRGQQRMRWLDGITDSMDMKIVRAMTHVINQGMAMYWGTSRWSAMEIMEAYSVARQFNMIPPVCEQAEYHLFQREKVEVQLPELYHKIGVGAMTWSPLACGIISGKYGNGVPESSRASLKCYQWLKERIVSEEGRKQQNKLKDLSPIAERLGCTLPQLAVAWCLRNEGVSSVLLGSSTPEQLIENLGAIQVLPKMTSHVVNEIDNILRNKPYSKKDYRS